MRQEVRATTVEKIVGAARHRVRLQRVMLRNENMRAPTPPLKKFGGIQIFPDPLYFYILFALPLYPFSRRIDP